MARTVVRFQSERSANIHDRAPSSSAPCAIPAASVELVVEAELLAPALERPALARPQGVVEDHRRARRQPRPELARGPGSGCARSPARPRAARRPAAARSGPAPLERGAVVPADAARRMGRAAPRPLRPSRRAPPREPARVASANRGSCSRLVTVLRRARAAAGRWPPCWPRAALDDVRRPRVDLAEHDTQPRLRKRPRIHAAEPTPRGPHYTFDSAARADAQPALRRPLRQPHRGRRQHAAGGAAAALAEARGPHLRQARGAQPDRLGQGPGRQGDDRGGRGRGRDRPGPDGARADLRQHGDRAGDDLPAQGLSVHGGDARQRHRGALAAAAHVRRRDRLLRGRQGLQRRGRAGAGDGRRRRLLLHALPVRQRGQPAAPTTTAPRSRSSTSSTRSRRSSPGSAPAAR